MSVITLNIPDAALPRIISAFVKVYNYQEFIKVNGVKTPNPETKVQFTRRMVIAFIKGVVKEEETRLAAANVVTDVDQIDIT